MRTSAKAIEEATRSQIYYCDVVSELPPQTRKSIPKEKWSAVRSLQNLDTRHNWMILVFFLVWLVSGWMALQADSILVQIPAVILMGFSLNGLTVIMHESCHSLLSKNPLVNRWLGFACGVSGLVAVSAYRSIHLAHHAFTKTEDDPDSPEVTSPKALPLVVVYYIILLIGIYLYLPSVAIVGFRKAKPDVRRRIVLEYALIFLGVGTIAAIVPIQSLLMVWVYPLLIAAQLSNVRGVAEHGLTTGGNEFTASRTVLSNRFVSFFMCNLNYHLEHHLFPGVPWYNLPALHKLLLDEYREAGSSVYRSYTMFLIDFFRTSFVQKIVPDVRLIPAHIRDEICA